MDDIIMDAVEQNTANEVSEARGIDTITAEIWLFKQQAGAAIIEIGQRLIEAKAMLPHGEWLPWLEKKVEFSEATAQRFMRLAKEYPNPSPVTDLGASKALLLLALPASEREEFAAEKHTVNGEEKTVAEMSRRELDAVIKERDAARKETEDLRGRLKVKEDELLKEQRRSADELQDASVKVQMLQQQLNNLLAEPRELPVVESVADEAKITAAVEKAKAEAEAAMRDDIKKAENAKAAAERRFEKANRELAAFKDEQKKQVSVAEAEKQQLAAELDALKKKMAVSSSTDATMFKLYFEQAQEAINKMNDCIERLSGNNEQATAEKLKAAMLALFDRARAIYAPPAAEV